MGLCDTALSVFTCFSVCVCVCVCIYLGRRGLEKDSV